MSSERRLFVVGIGLLIIIAAILRTWGLTFGLPYRYHIDETFYVAGALKMASGFDLPITTHGPNLFYMVLLGEYGIYYVFTRFTGIVSSAAAFEQLYRSDPTVFVLLARLTSAISGALTLVPTYLIGKKIHGKGVGIGSAVILGLSFQHIRESHYGTPDVFVGLLVTLCLLFCIALIENGKMRYYVLCGIMAGLATGTKFTNILLWMPLMVTHFILAWKDSDKTLLDAAKRIFSPHLGVMVLMFSLGFAFAYPNLVLRPLAFIEYVRFLIKVGKVGFITQFQIEPRSAWLYYIYSLSWGMGWLVVVFMIAGIFSVIIKKQVQGLLIIVFLLIYFIFLGRAPYYASRYLVPLLPLMCVLAALGTKEVVYLISKRDDKVKALIYVIAFVLLIIQPAAYSIRHNYLLTQTDTRTIAKEWIEDNLPAGTGIAIDWQKHAPPLRAMEDEFPANDVPYEIMIADGIGLPRYSLDDYRSMGINYLVMSSFIDDLMLMSPADREKQQQFHHELFECCELVYEIRPYHGDDKPPFVFDQIFGPVTSLWQFQRPGPVIRIYRLTP